MVPEDKSPKPQASSPPPRRPRGPNVVIGFGDDDDDEQKKNRQPKKPTVRIYLPPKAVASGAVKIKKFPPEK